LSSQNNYAPSWENHISVYQVEVPKEFGKRFRIIRNNTAHVNIKRAMPEFTLAQFYEEYHSFVYLLYEAGMTYWNTQNIEEHNLQSIEEFDLSVIS
jgi:hypothetical protein